MHFEACIQASFVVLMLTGGRTPCLPCWPIEKIKFQGKIDGFDIDDLIVFVQNPYNKERRKLLGQIKHSIAITQSSIEFQEVMRAAWNDFNNSKIFDRGRDVIALLTGPLSATDARSVPWLLKQARHTENVDEFFRKVQQTNFSPPKSAEKLEVIHHCLKLANGNNNVSKDEIYNFLKCFRLLSYDLSDECGVVLSLLYSHISLFLQQPLPEWVWSRVVDIVQTRNKNAGTITSSNIPDDLLEVFKQREAIKMSEDLKATQEKPKSDWSQHLDATYLALAVLIGSWNEKNNCDLEVIDGLLCISYEEWRNKAREILHHSDSPLSLTNGIWKVSNRLEFWRLLGSRILDHDLDRFKSLAVSILKEPNPAFELPLGTRYAASIYGKVLKYSPVLRKGMAEGLAILGSQPEVVINCSQIQAEKTCALVIRELLTDSDWVLWGSLNDLLPTLAEASPDEFLDLVEKAMRLKPCLFDELFSQEGDGITGGNYLTGLLWALEGLAWDEKYLVRVCVALGELASHDPGGQWSNRPENSLTNILLPWRPQTLASVDKRKLAVKKVLQEWPDIAWNLLIRLLPNQCGISYESHKPTWRKIIPDDWKKDVTDQEYWQQVLFYAELAVTAAGEDIARLSTLIDHFNNLPKNAFEQTLQVLASKPILELPEEKRLSIWEHLTKFTNQHRRFSDAQWVLPDELITRIENVAEYLAPTNPFNLYQHLFTNHNFELYEENGDWDEQRKKLDERRRTAILEIFQQGGIDGVIRFAESVSSPGQVGQALDIITDSVIERTLLPKFLGSADNKYKALMNGFIFERYRSKGWDWCDNLNKSDWTSEQIGQFLAYLPFIKKAWDRASEWLLTEESEYWTRTSANVYESDSYLADAIEKLIEHGRQHAAINCLGMMRHAKQPIDSDQCIRVLLTVPSPNEPSHSTDEYQIIELIKFLQEEPSVNQDDLVRVESAYIGLFVYNRGITPQLLENKLANDPEFFCELIQLIYLSRKEGQPPEEPTEKLKEIATNAWHLLRQWKMPPGTQKDRTFSEDHFIKWFERVKEICTESGHLKVALIHIGTVLIYAPPDPDGLWIHRAVADVLNDQEADDIRSGFSEGIYNSRGVHYVNPTGAPEKKLAEQLRSNAEEVENAGFQRFAVTLRSLAKNYDREAEQIILENKTDMDE